MNVFANFGLKYANFPPRKDFVAAAVNLFANRTSKVCSNVVPKLLKFKNASEDTSIVVLVVCESICKPSAVWLEQISIDVWFFEDDWEWQTVNGKAIGRNQAALMNWLLNEFDYFICGACVTLTSTYEVNWFQSGSCETNMCSRSCFVYPSSITRKVVRIVADGTQLYASSAQSQFEDNAIWAVHSNERRTIDRKWALSLSTWLRFGNGIRLYLIQ